MIHLMSYYRLIFMLLFILCYFLLTKIMLQTTMKLYNKSSKNKLFVYYLAVYVTFNDINYYCL